MNERKRKKVMLAFSIGFIFLCTVCISAFWIHSYRQATFEHISAFCEILMETDPKAEQQVLSALKEYHFLTEQEVNGNNFLSQYGYSVSEFCKGLQFDILILSSVLFFVVSCIFFLSARSIDKRNRKRIAELTDYLEQVNLGAGGTVIQTQEDDFPDFQRTFSLRLLLLLLSDKAL